jgi:hypothetical protein
MGLFNTRFNNVSGGCYEVVPSQKICPGNSWGRTRERLKPQAAD